MWDSDYVSDIEYMHGYFNEISPARLRLLLSASRQRVNIPANPTYLELGFGQGISLNIHAASNGGEYWGNDFNPAQVASARSLASCSKANIKLCEDSFEELAARDDLPEFDIIAMHGIWSWISEENRSYILDLVQRRLRPGGILYVSYNTTPGWSPATPMRHLMKQYEERLASGGTIQKLNSALDFADKVSAIDTGFFKANPHVRERLKKLRTQSPNYLAHEYLNANWDVLPFSEVASHMARAKMGFASSAHAPDLIDAINYPPEAAQLLAGIDDLSLRQTVRDYFVNQQFRRDIFVKGGRQLSEGEQREIVTTQRFVLTVAPENRPTEIAAGLGKIGLRAEIYDPVVQVLAADNFRPKSIVDMLADARCANLSISQLLQAILLLSSSNAVLPIQDDATVEAAKGTARAFNQELYRRAKFSAELNYLASPLTGSGIPVNRIEQLFISALDQGEEDPANWVWSILQSQNQKLVMDGKPIEGEMENLGELRLRLDRFVSQRLPILTRLGIC